MMRILAFCALVGLSGALFAAVPHFAPCSADVGTLSEGVRLFSDRSFTACALPEALRGKSFFISQIGGGMELTVEKGGELTAVTPCEGSFVSQAAELARMGFQRRRDTAAFQMFGKGGFDRAEIWTKTVKPGERLTFGKWVIVAGFDPKGHGVLRTETDKRIAVQVAGTGSEPLLRDILFSRPDYFVFAPVAGDHSRSMTGDLYNDHFQVIWNPSNRLLYAFWTQATRECDIDQHIAFSKSADRGLTWTKAAVIAGSANKKNPALRASWQQPMLSKSGRLYCLWNQQTTSRRPHCGQMFGAWSDDDGEHWSAPLQVVFRQRMDSDPADPLIPPSWCNWQRPLRLGKDGRFLVGCSRHGRAPYDSRGGCKIDFMEFANIDDNPEVCDIVLNHYSVNRESLTVPNMNGWEPACEEAALVKLPDGRLFALMRSSIGSPVWSQSRDCGVTWTRPKPLLDADGKPFPHPRSPCPMYDWKGCEAGSGIYFAFIHGTFDYSLKTAYQRRGPLYLIAGRFDPDGEQPVRFSKPKLFNSRPDGNSFYTSYTVIDGKGVLWYPDRKRYLLGKEIGPEWFR
jgi:hypothetical protein